MIGVFLIVFVAYKYNVISNTLGNLENSVCYCKNVTKDFESTNVTWILSHNDISVEHSDNYYNIYDVNIGNYYKCWYTLCHWDNTLKECNITNNDYDPYVVYFNNNTLQLYASYILLVCL